MEDLDIRLAMLKPMVRQRIKALMLSNGDVDILDAIAQGFKTSHDIAECLGVTTHTISHRLIKLRNNGYLARKETRENGRVEFIYNSIYVMGN